MPDPSVKEVEKVRLERDSQLDAMKKQSSMAQKCLSKGETRFTVSPRA